MAGRRSVVQFVLGITTGSSVVPTLRYRDLDRAVGWLCSAFGFVPRKVVQGPEGQIVSAQLVLGNGMVMLAPVGQSGFDELMTQPDEIDGRETQSCYFVISDSASHYAAAKEHGAEIVLDLQDFEHGGSGYLCRDLEGHIWSFGTFDPWSVARPRPPIESKYLEPLFAFSERPHGQATFAGLAVAGLIAAGAALAMSFSDAPREVVAAEPRPSAIALFKERRARLAAERNLAALRTDKEAADADGDKLREQLEHLTLAKEAAERASRRLLARAVGERQKMQSGSRHSEDLAQALERERQGKQKSERAFQILKGQLEKELLAKETLVTARKETDAHLDKERETRKRAEQSLQQALDKLKKEQEARKAAETVAQQAVPAPADKPLSPPRPAKRPETKSE